MVANKFLNSLINYERIVKPDYNFKLDNFRKFLKCIQSPHKKLPNVILIAGTKGKGSTATFIEAGLRACGLRTALYTSPHILSLQERIKINNRQISERDLNRLVAQIKPQAEKHQITFFEAITAIAFLYYLEKKVDYTVLEVGLGGRLDATNVSNPKVSVITKIGYDHLEVLGKTLPKIAYEKAGIIHQGGFVVVTKQKPSALKVIMNKMLEMKNQYCYTPDNFTVKDIITDLSGSQFRLQENGGHSHQLCIKPIGRHQIENAVTAFAVLNHLKKRDGRITYPNIQAGLSQAQIMARCQIISRNPIIMIDSAHNPESAESLCRVIKNIIKQRPIIIFGSSQGKLVSKMLNILAPVTRQFILTQSQNPRHIPVDTLAQLCQQKSISYQTTDSVAQAIQDAKRLSKNKIPIVITGSFYIAGEALDCF